MMIVVIISFVSCRDELSSKCLVQLLLQAAQRRTSVVAWDSSDS
jgi:hypothetical protein